MKRNQCEKNLSKSERIVKSEINDVLYCFKCPHKRTTKQWLLKHLLEHHEYDPTENDGFIQCLDCGEKIEDIQLFKVNFEKDLLMISLSDPCIFSFFTMYQGEIFTWNFISVLQLNSIINFLKSNKQASKWF